MLMGERFWKLKQVSKQTIQINNLKLVQHMPTNKHNLKSCFAAHTLVSNLHYMYQLCVNSMKL